MTYKPEMTTAPKHGHKSLLYSEVVSDLNSLDRVDIAVLGIPYGSPYSIDEVTNDQTNGPTAVRQATDRAVRSIERYDFDIGGPLMDNQDIRMVDCGDIAGDARAPGQHYVAAEAVVRKILQLGGMPLVIGGDHGVPIPVLRALDELNETITLIHVDAHLDWRQDVNGVTDGYSSPIRRASEMKHIGEIWQIGLRANGSARQEEVDAALEYGAKLIPAHQLHDEGIDSLLARIPDGGHYYITCDADGIDPTIMPAVNGPALGGVTYHQMRKLIQGLVKKGKVVGMDLVEITPKKDINQITAITACRFFVNLIGSAVRAGYFHKK
ncbi:agmatinase [Raoultella sp. BIGb0138]|uniref:agmatinase n=1 Tax=Raoultella sp. BIGb0138 TaxID=2485115 RepID=UPI001050D1DE|nr:agmatinase [Raoultella sp. BIGb0138]TCW12365.1 agmatinase [Raoultella sp. BIGb0138]